MNEEGRGKLLREALPCHFELLAELLVAIALPDLVHEEVLRREGGSGVE